MAATTTRNFTITQMVAREPRRSPVILETITKSTYPGCTWMRTYPSDPYCTQTNLEHLECNLQPIPPDETVSVSRTRYCPRSVIRLQPFRNGECD